MCGFIPNQLSFFKYKKKKCYQFFSIKQKGFSIGKKQEVDDCEKFIVFLKIVLRYYNNRHQIYLKRTVHAIDQSFISLIKQIFRLLHENSKIIQTHFFLTSLLGKKVPNTFFVQNFITNIAS